MNSTEVGAQKTLELLNTVTGCLKEKLTSSHLTGGCFEVAAEETAPERSKARSDNIRQMLHVINYLF